MFVTKALFYGTLPICYCCLPYRNALDNYYNIQNIILLFLSEISHHIKVPTYQFKIDDQQNKLCFIPHPIVECFLTIFWRINYQYFSIGRNYIYYIKEIYSNA